MHTYSAMFLECCIMHEMLQKKLDTSTVTDEYVLIANLHRKSSKDVSKPMLLIWKGHLGCIRMVVGVSNTILWYCFSTIVQ